MIRKEGIFLATMGSSIYVVALLTSFPSLIAAISPPIPVRICRNSTPLSLPISVNSSNLTTPEPPAGFETKLLFDDQTLMNPIQMYINTIELMADWAVLPWDSYMRGRQRRSGPQFSTEIAISPWPAGLTSQLQIKHAVTGLYRAGIAIAKGNKFYGLAVELIEQSLIIGKIIFQPRRITNNSINLAEGIYPIGTFSAQSGSRDDARDPKFKILYKFDGIRISSSEAFTSVLDGLATSAMHDKDDRGAFINAYSSSYTSTINIHGVGVQSDQLSWYHITRALVLIWYVVVSGPITRRVPSYEGMEFTLEYDGKKIGEGHLWNFSGVGNDMGGRAISK